jgi:hypothetical protein
MSSSDRGVRLFHRGAKTLGVLMVVSAALLILAGNGGSVWAAFTDQTSSPANELRSADDFVPPSASATVVQKAEGGIPGFIRQGGGYRVFAGVTDTGNPASGVATVNGNLSSITTGLTATPLTAGSFTIGGVGYGFRSGALTARTPLSAATYAYSLSSTDAAANARTQTGYTVTVDNTVPSASNVQTTNKSGNIAGRPDIGDTVILTFSEQIEPNSILAGWSGASTNVVVRIGDNASSGSNDLVSVFNASNTAQLPLGTVNLGRNDYVNANATFGVTGTAATMTQSGSTITLVLGTASSGPRTASSTGTMIWSPSATATDRAGNPETTANRSETGTVDRDF